MKYYFLPLKLSESKMPSNYGWKFVHENEGRLVESDVLIEVNTYDRGTTRILYDNVVYLIKKDFVDISNSSYLKPESSLSNFSISCTMYLAALDPAAFPSAFVRLRILPSILSISRCTSDRER